MLIVEEWVSYMKVHCVILFMFENFHSIGRGKTAEAHTLLSKHWFSGNCIGLSQVTFKFSSVKRWLFGSNKY